MALIQEWAADPSALDSTPETAAVQSGPTTAAGSGLFARAFIRSSGGLVPDQLTITDDAGTNTWSLIDQAASGSAFIYLLHAPDADPITSVSLTWVEQTTGQPYAEEAAILLSEFSDVGPLIDTSTAIISGGGQPPPITPTAPGQLLIGLGGTNIGTIDWNIAGTGLTPTELVRIASGNASIDLTGGYGYTADATTPVSLGWDQGSSSDRDYPLVNALFDLPGSTPPPTTDTGRYLLTGTGWAPVTTELL